MIISIYMKKTSMRKCKSLYKIYSHLSFYN